MDLNEIKANLKQELSYDNLETLGSLKRYVSISSNLYDEIILQESRLRQINKDFQLNIVSRADKDLGADKVRLSTLERIKRRQNKDRLKNKKGHLQFINEVERENQLYLENREKLNNTLNWWKDKMEYLEFEHTTYETEKDDGDIYTITEKEKYENFKFTHYGSIINISYDINQIRIDKSLKVYYDRYIEIELNLKELFDIRLEKKESEKGYFGNIIYIKFTSIYGKRCFKIMEVIKRDIMDFDGDIHDETPPIDNEFELTSSLMFETKNQIMAEKFVDSIKGIVNLLNEKID